VDNKTHSKYGGNERKQDILVINCQIQTLRKSETTSATSSKHTQERVCDRGKCKAAKGKQDGNKKLTVASLVFRQQEKIIFLTLSGG
jgi:hypothetical protein